MRRRCQRLPPHPSTIRLAWPTTPRRPATRARCSSIRRRPPRGPHRWARIARPLLTCCARFGRGSTRRTRCSPACSSGERTRATCASSSTKRSRRSTPPSTSIESSTTGGAWASRCGRFRDFSDTSVAVPRRSSRHRRRSASWSSCPRGLSLRSRIATSRTFTSIRKMQMRRSCGPTAHWRLQKLGHVEARVYAEINLAVVEYLATQSPALVDEFERIFRLAKEHGLDEHAGRALLHLTWWSPRFKSYDVADRYYDSGLDFSIERGLDLWRHYMLAYRARCEMDRGRWDEATRLAELVIRDPLSPVPRIVALVVLGLVRARRGDPGFWPPLDEAAELAAPSNELQRREPVATARAEALWLEGREGAIPDATAPTS